MSPVNIDEKDLIARIRKGERAAWDELVDGYGRLIYYAIQRTLEMKGVRRSPEDVQDIFQSIFVHLAEDSGRRLLSYTGKHKCTLASWIRMIAVNYTIDMIRRQAKYSFHVDFEEVNSEEFEKSWFEGHQTPDQHLMEKETENQLLKCLAELDKDDRAFLELFLKGMSPKELARLYRVNATNIYSRYNRIKAKLKKAAEIKGEG
jgi:RNA polymerase sigma factor (sigma-70 family)